MKTTTLPTNPELTYVALRFMTVSRAVNYLTYVFDAALEEILDLSDCHQKWATTPAELVTSFNAGQLACDTPVVFWGGPPDAGDWYTGTLLTMLVDRLFYSVAQGDIGGVGRFTENLQ